MVNNYFKSLLILIINISLLIPVCKGQDNEKEKERDGALEFIMRDIKMMKDPVLGYVPSERLIKAKNYKDQLMQSILAPLSGVTWKEQGPNNLGGRTRTIMVDPNDVTGNTIWAGSVGGGLWKTTNINTAAPNWVPVNDLASNLAVSSIAYDPSNTQVMYFSTGEGYGNIDAIRGFGVWKSTNGGTSWTQLASTTGSTFNYCQKIVVNSTGIVFVATSSGGLQRSSNGGTTWTKVLGSGLAIAGAVSNFCYDVEIAANGDVYGALYSSVHKSTNAGVTFAGAQTLGITAERIELACAPNDANYVYAIVENANAVNGILRTINGGTAWVARTEPADADPGCPPTDFSNGQGWYNLAIAVDPLNRERLFVGGLDIFVSSDGAGTWSQVAHWYGGFSKQYAHADQHNVLFKPGSSSVAYFVNDGGVYQTTNANDVIPTLADKNLNYRTAQFYACAIHPTAQTSYYLAGSQDNGTHQFKQNGLQATTEATGGDGAFCHIDQNEPQYQFTQYVYNEFYRSSDGGSTWTNVISSGGQFISPSDYDDVNNRLYVCRNAGDYLRWDNPQTGSTFTAISIASFNSGQVSAVKVSPNTANRVFFGIDNGRVVKVDNANNAVPTATSISTGLPAGYVSCVEVETGNDNHLLATFSNYGVNSIWESTNGGTSWTSVEGNLPDMPIRWALFNPNNNDQALIATELGVWSTDNLNGGATNWGTSNSGLANVRVDMLQLRSSDKYVIAATHGRGLYASDLFTTPTALFHSDKQLSYINSSIQFTSDSYQATGWSWNFGDGSPLSTLENPTHSYATSGKFNVTLTINAGVSTLTKNQYIHILPNRGTPYLVATDGGTFEINPNDFGSQSIRGGIDKWARGVPTNFLTTVNSAVNAWKTDLAADLTVGDYACVLQTPSYNFTSSASAYTLRFRRSMEITFCNAPFAVQVQYSTDKGINWTRLGAYLDAAGTNWYNRGPSAACPIDVSVFPDQYGWTITSNNILASYNITTGAPSLVGQPDVTFRIVLSVAPNFSASGYAVDGFMVDDFEILGPVNAPISNASIVTTGTLTPFTSCAGTASAQQSFTVSGTGLTANLVVTPPTGYEVSITSGSGFLPSLSFTPVSGTVSTTTIFVRITASASGSPSGNVACTSTGTTTQNVAASGTVNSLPLPVISGSLSFCTGGSTTLNAGVFTSYLWSTGATSQTIPVSTAGTFTVTVTNAGGCTGLTSATTSINSLPSCLITGNSTVCSGILTSWCATAGMTSYLWNTGATSQCINVSTTGSFSVTITNANGCTSNCNKSLTVNANPAPVITGNLSICSGGSTTLDAGVSTSYLWSTGATTQTIPVNTAGTFTVTVTNANGCTGLTSATTTINPLPSCLITGSSSVCSGGSTQWCAPAGMTSYLWSTSATSQCINVSSAGSFSVTITNANGCTSNCNKSLTVNANPAPVITGNLSICSGGSTTLDAGVFTSYLWSTGATSQTIPVSTVGTFTVTVTNANGCSGLTSVTTAIISSPSCLITGNSSVCSGSSTSWCATAGMTSYLWNTGATSQCISVSTAGSFSVTITSANGCTSNCNKTLTVNANPAPTITGSLSFCTGGSTILNAGVFTSYLWSTGASSQTIPVSTAGTFTVTVTNASGCTGLTSATTTINTLPSCLITGNSSVCSGSSTSWCATAGMTTYLWNTGATSQCINVSSAGSFSVTITNSNGCTSNCNKTLTVNANPAPVITGNLSICSGGSTTLNAGVFTSYLWSTGATSQTIPVSTAGTFTVTVTNASGCTGLTSATTTINPLPSCLITGNSTVCSGSSTSWCAPVGMTSYSWNTGATSQCINVGSAGSFSVTITNANGCTSNCNKSLTVNANPAPTITGSLSFCSGGSTTLNAGVFTSYLWSTGATGQTIPVSTAGTFTVTVTNASGCTGLTSATTTINPLPSCLITGNSTVCSGSSTSWCAPGGMTSYLWSTGATSQCINVSSAGSFSVTITNANGCTSNCNKTLTVNANPAPTITGSLSFCPGGSTTLNAGVFMSYLWSTGSTSQTIPVNTAGTFTVTVTNASGCTGLTSATTTINALPSCLITGNSSVCSGSLTSWCATAGMTSYLWNTGATSQCINVSSAGSFSVTITNSNGCTSNCNKSLTVNANPVPTITGSLSFCSGGSTNLNAGVFTSYLWSTGATSQTIPVSTAGTFTVTVTNSSGCTGLTSVTTTFNATPSCLITGNSSVCSGSSTSWCATAGMTSYLWNTGATTTCINVSSAGSFSVTITQANGCTSNCNKSLTVNSNPAPVITGSLSFCIGGSTTLNAGVFTNYLWSTGATSQTIPVNTAGTFTVTVTNASGCTGSTSVVVTSTSICGITLNLKTFFEAFYDSVGTMRPALHNFDPMMFPMNACDTITIELHATTMFYPLVESKKVLMFTNGTATATFLSASLNSFYYIVVRHRNTIETWSKNSVLFNSTNMNYDFTAP